VGSELIVHTLYGPQFSPSAQLLSILIWSEFAIFFGSAVGNLLLARGLQNYLIYPTIAGATVNVLLNLIWIPRHAAVGSAWATLVSYTFAWAVVLLGFADTRGMVWEGLRKGVPVALLSAVVAVIVSHLPLPSVVRLATALGLYGAGVGVIRTIKAADIQYLRTALGHILGRSS
jgi:O-antigen/teichoic acid export membrane protein